MQYIVCTSDIWWHSIDIIVMYHVSNSGDGCSQKVESAVL